MYNLNEMNAPEKVFNIRERTFKFSVSIIHLTQNLPRTTAGFAIGNQLIRSGTSIGANIEEAQNAGTRKEFIHILTISLKEARETEYWLRLIAETKLTAYAVTTLLEEVKEIIKILTTIVKKTKANTGGLQS